MSLLRAMLSATAASLAIAVCLSVAAGHAQDDTAPDSRPAGGTDTAAAWTQWRFVSVRDGSLWEGDERFLVKGINYFPRRHGWGLMWEEWSPDEVDEELTQAERLGCNAIRAFPMMGGTEGEPEDNPYLPKYEEFMDLCSRHGLRVIWCFSPLDRWWLDPTGEGTSPGGADPGSSATWDDYDRFLTCFVGYYRDEPRVLAWDLGNELDSRYGYDPPRTNRENMVGWLGRISEAVRKLDANHPVTIGNASSLSAGDYAHLTDFTCFHFYNWLHVGVDVEKVEALSGGQPVLVEEMGRNTSPGPGGYTEEEQAEYYRAALEQLRFADAAGVMSWVLCDFTPDGIRNDNVSEVEYHYGLLRSDLTWKPAARVFQEDFLPPPSVYAASPASVELPDGPLAPNQPFEVRVTMRNDGTCGWTSGNAISLGIGGPNDIVFPGNRVALPRDVEGQRYVVEQGDQCEFLVKGQAPPDPGVFTAQWAMVREGLLWFGEAATIRIEVIAP